MGPPGLSAGQAVVIFESPVRVLMEDGPLRHVRRRHQSIVRADTQIFFRKNVANFLTSAPTKRLHHPLGRSRWALRSGPPSQRKSYPCYRNRLFLWRLERLTCDSIFQLEEIELERDAAIRLLRMLVARGLHPERRDWLSEALQRAFARAFALARRQPVDDRSGDENFSRPSRRLQAGCD